jgi:hypothetical protein
MMNVPPSEAKALSLWEYEALLHNWNEAHNPDGSVEAPDHERTQRMIEKLNANPALLVANKAPA